MSSVLWANALLRGTVTSDESDKWALYRHTDKLDELTRTLKLLPFASLCDATDAEFHLGDAVVVAELEQSIAFAKQAADLGAQFNFAIVT
jgi:hypothetical protein